MSAPKICVLLSLFLTAFSSVSEANLEDEYTNSAFLDEAMTFKLHWKLNNKEKIVSFAVQVKTLGWVGFGISAGKGNMVGSDVVIGWVKDNKAYFKDRYADSKALPPIDEQQDYELLGAEEKNGETIMKFKRLFDTCDKRDRKIEEGTLRVVYAYHTDDPSSETSIPKHTKRGARSLDILGILETKPDLPNDLKYFDLVQDKVEIPNSSTTYLCKAFEIEQFPTKRHIVKIDPVISSGNEGLVHHMILYECGSDFPRSNISLVAHCYRPNMPPAITSCAGSSVVAGWGIGGGSFYYPKHVGLAVGVGQGLRYVVLETHYDNQAKKRGIRDSSGLRFFYTATTRQYDAGVMWVGWVTKPSLIIPPKQVSWQTYAYCHRNCTQIGLQNSTLPDKGIKVFASGLHSHLQGTALWTKHVRNGKELPEIARDDHFDFNYQEYRMAREEIHIKPGDDIIQVCQYQTMDKKRATFGGISTDEEMCLNFIYYYPKVELNMCLSSDYVTDQFIPFLPTLAPTGNSSRPVPNLRFNWTSELAQTLKELYANSSHVKASCRFQNGERLPLRSRQVPKPIIVEPYVKKEEECKAEPPHEAALNMKAKGLVLVMAMIVTLMI